MDKVVRRAQELEAGARQKSWAHGQIASTATERHDYTMAASILMDKVVRLAQELEAGAGQKGWVQSQTTFAALVRDEHARGGGLRARVLKQKIWVEGVSYELQEIYGIDSLNSRRRVRGRCLSVSEKPCCGGSEPNYCVPSASHKARCVFLCDHTSRSGQNGL